jgi:DNA-directed RNA polymerase specialized sigma subunit
VTVKEYLQAVRKQYQELKAAEMEMERLDYEAYHLQAVKMNERVQTSHQADLSETLERLESYRETVTNERNALLSMRMQARLLIGNLHNAYEKAVLNRRYLQCQAWEDIAKGMAFTQRTVFRIHGQALQHLDPFYQKMSVNVSNT